MGLKPEACHRPKAIGNDFLILPEKKKQKAYGGYNKCSCQAHIKDGEEQLIHYPDPPHALRSGA